ncbi:MULTISPECIES: NUDIX hydrolase [Saliphagus]|uniref:NUDIX hydrolase n=1 Tax=Saliphagus infecundisoli TaxID=1849069 RepID=A0ABD5QIB3_9EURY|nr:MULTISPECIES: NUDIX hydrolase [Saliphagus]
MDRFPPEVPREPQTLRLPESKLHDLREWALEGTALAAATRVLDPDGRIALVRNAWTDGWFLPGGSVEPGEPPAAAARRELREETGLEGTVGSPLVVLDQRYVSADDGRERFSARFVVYSARASGEIPDPSELGVAEDEIEAARWFESLPEALHDDEYLREYL